MSSIRLNRAHRIQKAVHYARLASTRRAVVVIEGTSPITPIQALLNDLQNRELPADGSTTPLKKKPVTVITDAPPARPSLADEIARTMPGQMIQLQLQETKHYTPPAPTSSRQSLRAYQKSTAHSPRTFHA